MYAFAQGEREGPMERQKKKKRPLTKAGEEALPKTTLGSCGSRDGSPVVDVVQLNKGEGGQDTGRKDYFARHDGTWLNLEPALGRGRGLWGVYLGVELVDPSVETRAVGHQ